MWRPHGTNVDVLVPRHRVRNLVLVPRHRVRHLYGRRQQMVRRCWSQFHRHHQLVQDLPCETGTRVEDTTFARIFGTGCRCDFRKQCVLSVPLCELGERKYEFRMLSFTTTVLNFALAEEERMGKTRNFSDVHWTWIGRFECRQVVSGFEVQPLRHCDHFST